MAPFSHKSYNSKRPSSDIFNSYFCHFRIQFLGLRTLIYKKIPLRCINLTTWYTAINNWTCYVMKRSWVRVPPGVCYFPPHKMSINFRLFQGHSCSCVKFIYRQTSNITGTKSQSLALSRLAVQLSLLSLLTPCVQPRMKMYLEQRLHLSDQQFYWQQWCTLY